jgi:phosphate transport system protein
MQVPSGARILDDQLDRLRATVCEMGGRVEAAVGDSIAALIHGDQDGARAVIAADARIDALAAEAEHEAICLIALQAPVAGDLRQVMAAFKISALLARMGDCAKNIAHRAIALSDCRKMEQLRIVPAMEEAVSAMVKGALDSFSRRDSAAAAAVLEADQAVDDQYDALFGAIVAHMGAHPESVREAAHLMFVGQKLERIADHAAAIAEIVRASLTGAANAPDPREAVRA